MIELGIGIVATVAAVFVAVFGSKGIVDLVSQWKKRRSIDRGNGKVLLAETVRAPTTVTVEGPTSPSGQN